MEKEEFGTYPEKIKQGIVKRPIDLDDKEIVDEIMSQLDEDKEEIQNEFSSDWRREELLKRNKYPKD